MKIPSGKNIDPRAPRDERLFRFRHTESVFPLPEWGSSLEEWKSRRRAIKARLQSCCGVTRKMREFRPKAHLVRSFDCGDVTIENLSIETLPGFYVQANLARRKDASGRLPLMLNAHGHTARGRTTPREDGLSSVPHRLIHFALQGFASFTWSMVDYDEDSRQLPHTPYLQGEEGKRDNLWGYGPFAVQTHNSLKLLDYLCSRDDIDEGKVGCTGNSGGGTQTYFLSALDERVKAAAPAVMVSGHFHGGCVCENHPVLRLDYSNVHYAGLIAPRPLMLCGCSGDWTHHTPMREFADLRRLYGLYGKEDRIGFHMNDEEHNYNRELRESVYAWMRRWLVDPEFDEDCIPEGDHPIPPPEDLLVYDCPVPPHTGALEGRDRVFDLWRTLRETEPAAANIKTALAFNMPDDDDLLMRSMPPRYRLEESRDLAKNKIVYGRFSDGSRVEGNLVFPRNDRPCLVVVGRGAVKEPPEPVLGRLIEDGFGIMAPSLFLVNTPEPYASCWRELSESYLFTTYNRTADSNRAQDILTTLKVLIQEMRVPPEQIQPVAEPPASLTAFIAWAYACSELPIGPFIGDFGGTDLEDDKNWEEHGYFPFIRQYGGIEGLSKSLCEGKKAFISGVRGEQKNFFPGSFEVSEEILPLKKLLIRSGMSVD